MKWPVVAFGDLFDISSSKRVLQRDWKNEGVPFYRAREIVKLARDGYVENDLFISERHYCELKNENGVPETNDLMISAVGTLGACYIVRGNDRFYYKDASVLRFSPKIQLHTRYFFHAFRTSEILDQVNAGGGSTVGTYTIERARKTKIALPPLAEQKRIAELLDTADGIIRLRKQAIAKLDELEQSVFVDMFGNKNSIKLKEACKFISGGTPNKDEPKFWNGSYPWISSADIDGEQIKSFRHFVTDEALAKSSTNIVPKNSILVVTRTGVGKVIVCDQSMCFSQDITGLLIKDNFDPHFIAAAIRNKKNEIVSQARGATIKGVTRDVIENIDVPIASLEDQYLFAEKIHQIHKQLTVQKKCMAHLTLMQNSLQHQSFAVN